MQDLRFASYPDGLFGCELLDCYMALKSIRFLDCYHPAPSFSLVLVLYKGHVLIQEIPSCSTPNLPSCLRKVVKWLIT